MNDGSRGRSCAAIGGLRWLRVFALAGGGIALLAGCGGSQPPAGRVRGAAPPPLSAEPAPVDVASTFGSGSFGSWFVDRFGLPAYRYEVDQNVAPQAPRAELGGITDAWHQLGNDHIVANAYNHGYVQLWSQDRLYQWANLHEPSAGHYAGGYGYLRTAGRIDSTHFGDRAADGQWSREFGIGYARKAIRLPGVTVEEHVYAPFGDDPILLHEVTIANTSSAPLAASWFEYWDVNPYVQVWGLHRGFSPPEADAAGRTIMVQQLPQDTDVDPLAIYAAVLDGGASGFDTDAGAFFGAGGRARPDAVAADRTTQSIAPANPHGQTGSAMVAFRSPVAVPAGGRVTLRYAYGSAHARDVPQILARHRAAGTLEASQDAWRAWLPRASFGTGEQAMPWLARELQWDAYMVRSGQTYEEACGHHILSQGGYYQYGLGLQGGFRDQLGLSLSMISADPEIVRETIRYSAQQQERASGHVPYAMGHMCTPVALPSADLDFWFFLAAAEYALATRDLAFFDENVRFADGGEASLWDHLKLAYTHMERVVGRGPHGGYYVSASTGDWTDFSAQFMQMTESMLVTAQLAYAYPRLAQVAELRGDADLAAGLRRDGDELLRVLRAEWTGRWFSRGYSGNTRLGVGAIYQEPQPWALLAGAADAANASSLVANVLRFLTGIGAPGGPSPIGSAQSPAANDPDVGERAPPQFQEAGALGSYGGGNAVFLGGVWYALNGPLAWALGRLDGQVADARALAWDEYLRNTLAWHAQAFPDRWNGVLSVDDVCWAWYAKDKGMCGDEVLAPQYRYAGQILNKHAWWLWTIQKLAGIEPDALGYRIEPHLPFAHFSLRLPGVGIAAEPGSLRGYVRTERADRLLMRVRLPATAATVRAWVAGESVPVEVAGDTVAFTLQAGAARAPADWAVAWGAP
ncbi:MAG: hypothetical protein HYV18_02835 [Gammaproteobacteria bacterium]|nr:hypothetical protein [Gammaproteobacteria bacterium]